MNKHIIILPLIISLLFLSSPASADTLVQGKGWNTGCNRTIQSWSWWGTIKLGSTYFPGGLLTIFLNYPGVLSGGYYPFCTNAWWLYPCVTVVDQTQGWNASTCYIGTQYNGAIVFNPQTTNCICSPSSSHTFRLGDYVKIYVIGYYVGISTRASWSGYILT